MSAICPTCKSSLSCGCQRRVASNGTPVCTLCMSKYEAGLLAKKTVPSTAPSNVGVVYSPPPKN